MMLVVVVVVVIVVVVVLVVVVLVVVVAAFFTLSLMFQSSASGILTSRRFVLIYVLNNTCGMVSFNTVHLFIGGNSYGVQNAAVRLRLLRDFRPLII